MSRLVVLDATARLRAGPDWWVVPEEVNVLRIVVTGLHTLPC